ncbi:hypothetical protein D3C81_1996840 [compost metagenome]
MRHQHAYRKQQERFETVLMGCHRAGAQTSELCLLFAWLVIVVTTLLFHRFGHGHTRHEDQQGRDKHTPERNTHQAASLFASGNGASVGV